METFYYLNGKFIDRDSGKPKEIARCMNAKIVSLKKFNHPVCGTSWRLELSK